MDYRGLWLSITGLYSVVILRTAIANNSQIYYQFDALFQQFHVDLFLTGHVHFYERMLPIYNWTVGTWDTYPNDNNYTYFINPSATINVIEGIAGNSEDIGDVIYDPMAGFSAIVNNVTAYGVLTAWNSSVLQYQHLSSFDNSVIDDFYIIKNPEYVSFASESTGVGRHLSVIIIVGLIALLVIGGLMVFANYKKAKNNSIVY